jgi:hypothetical protein
LSNILTYVKFTKVQVRHEVFKCGAHMHSLFPPLHMTCQ